MPSTRVCTILACISGLCAAASSLHAQQCANQKLLASDRASADGFGASISGTYTGGNGTYTPNVAIGAPQDDNARGVDAGSVYLFARFAGIWSQVGNVTASDGLASDYFGTSVGYADPYLVVGAPGAGTGGAAYFYERVSSSFVQKTKILLPGVAAGDDVGRAVSFANNSGWGPWALVSAPLRNVNFGGTQQNPSDPDAGVVMLCTRQANGTWALTSTWPLDRTAANSGQYAGEHYGAAVAIHGDWVAVCGAPYGHLGGAPAQSGYIDAFRFDPVSTTWVHDFKLAAPDAHAGDHYGSAVAITNGQYIAIGAPDQDGTAGQLPGLGAKTDNGCVYIQEKDLNGVWHFDGQIFASDATNGAHFGSSVALQENVLVVGASGAKRTYIFKRVTQGWVQTAAFNDPDSTGSFSSGVTIALDSLVIADVADSDAGPPSLSAQGAAYAYPLPGYWDSTIASDSCAAATYVSAGTYTGCTSAATLDGATNCGGFLAQGPDVWYAWWPSCSGGVVIDTVGSSYDTILSVHSACPGTAANTLACNDDTAPGTTSRVAFNAAAGTLYYIRLSGYGGAAGNFTLHITEDQRPANDDCASAQRVGNGTIPMSTCHSTLDGPTDQACASIAGPDVWFRYTATSTGPCAISTCAANFDTVLMVYPSACPATNFQAIACNDDGPGCGGQTYGQSYISTNLTSGQTYTIRVSAFPGVPQTSGQGNLIVQPTCPCDFNGGGLSVQDIFDYLAAYFGGSFAADINGDGHVSVQDIFDFLACYFGGCH